jgi:hypothetical protein
MLFSDNLLTLFVQLSPTSTLRSETATLLRAAGVAALLAMPNCDVLHDEASLPLPLLRAMPVGEDDLVQLSHVEGPSTSCAWPRGTFAEVQQLAIAMPPARRWMTSLAPGRARSSELLAQSAIDAWKLRTAGCSALVLPLDELSEAAEADGDWDRVAQQLVRMRRAVSAVDYPPTIFHIGEDELVTRPEVE